MKKALRTALLSLAALSLVGSAASAQKLSFGFQKSLGHKSGIQVVYQSGFGHPRFHQPVVCAPRVIWIAPHYESVRQQVWVPGTTQQVFVPPVFETRYDHCGNPYQVLVCAGYWKTVTTPGCYETRIVGVWQPGYWKHA